MVRARIDPMLRRTGSVAIASLALVLAACSPGGAAPTATPGPSDTATAPLPTKTAFPTFTPTPTLGAGNAIVVGGDLRVRSAPATNGPVVSTLTDLAPVQLAGA